MADRFGGFIARREAILAKARLDASRWLDDGGSFSPEAVAVAAVLANPRTDR